LGGKIEVRTVGRQPDEGGILLFDVSGAASGTVDIFSSTNCDILDETADSHSSLDGTTGTNGKLSILASHTNGKIYVENRLGASVTMAYRFETSWSAV